jgi:hypothetical protein
LSGRTKNIYRPVAAVEKDYFGNFPLFLKISDIAPKPGNFRTGKFLRICLSS